MLQGFIHTEDENLDYHWKKSIHVWFRNNCTHKQEVQTVFNIILNAIYSTRHSELYSTEI